MEKIHIHDKVFVPFMSYGQVSEIIDGVASRLNEDFRPVYGSYADDPKEDIPIVLCVLNGAIMFTGELLERLDFPVELVSMKLSSYSGTQSTGKVRELMGLTADVRGRTVIVCEDIVDTGTTIAALKASLLEKGAADVRICTMLLKPDVYKGDTALDYVGASIPNKFIVGFGLDYDEQGRNLKDIYVLE